jgi:hypothetical protein
MNKNMQSVTLCIITKNLTLFIKGVIYFRVALLGIIFCPTCLGGRTYIYYWSVVYQVTKTPQFGWIWQAINPSSQSIVDFVILMASMDLKALIHSYIIVIV